MEQKIKVITHKKVSSSSVVAKGKGAHDDMTMICNMSKTYGS